jgi:hypothetical protein
MLPKFVHIGYPKNFSTSLQYDFFAKHGELFHLGIGPSLAYSDAIVDATFEVFLKTAKGFKYAEAEAALKKHFEELFFQAEQSGKKAITASSEHLSFAFANDSIGFEEKMARLARLFGKDTHIILIIRNQPDLIKSLYRESVRVGFPGDFGTYMYLFYKYQDRNYCYDLRYDLVYEALLRYFDREQLHLFVFEDMRAADGKLVREDGKIKLLKELSDAMNVAYHEIDFGHYNEALSDNVVREKAKLNFEHRHDLGNILFETAEKHRMKHYLLDEIKLTEPEDVLYADVRTKRALIARATEMAAGKPAEKLDYTIPGDIADRLKSFYEKANRALQSRHGIQLPENYFNLRF